MAEKLSLADVACFRRKTLFYVGHNGLRSASGKNRNRRGGAGAGAARLGVTLSVTDRRRTG